MSMWPLLDFTPLPPAGIVTQSLTDESEGKKGKRKKREKAIYSLWPRLVPY